MKRNATFLSICFAVLAGTVVVYGCSSDDENKGTPTNDAGAQETSTTDDAGNVDASANPAPPAIGAQLDRVGRPAINTATSKTFDPANRGAAEDAYNKDGDHAGWAAKYKGDIAASLAVYDGLDTKCGNQIFADADAGADRYGTLASVLADDRLWLDTAKADCKQYLGVELNATGAIPNTDCGGRAPSYDVIDLTYSALAVGAPSGVTDGIDRVAEKTDGTTFPYLAAP